MKDVVRLEVRGESGRVDCRRRFPLRNDGVAQAESHSVRRVPISAIGRSRPTRSPSPLMLLCLLATLCFLLPASAAIPNPFPPDSVVISTLPNGLRLVVKEDHALPIVAGMVVIRGGSSVEGATRGTAHYVEHCVFQSTQHYPDRMAPQRALEQVGGISNGETTRDYSRLEASVPSENAELLVNVLADIALAPALTDAIIRGQRSILLAEVQQSEDDPLSRVMTQSYQLAYATHPYRYDPAGTVSDLLRLTPDDVRRYHDLWYVPNNMSVVLVGDITGERALQLVTAAFGMATRGTLPARPTPEVGIPGDPPTMHILKPLTDTYEVVAYGAPSASNFSNMVATDVLVTMLADGPDAMLPGWWGKDGVKIADFGAEFISAHDPGRLMIWALTNPQATEALQKSTDSLLQSIARGSISADTLSLARQRLATQFLLQNETYTGQAGTLAFYEALYGAQWAPLYVPAVADVSLDRLRTAVPLEPLAIVTLGAAPVIP
jgi:zinc protease